MVDRKRSSTSLNDRHSGSARPVPGLERAGQPFRVAQPQGADVPAASCCVAGPSPATPEFDPDFDLAFHLRRVTAAAPGTIDTILEMARLAEMADFDRARPLWEVTLIDGLADGGAALLCKLHHSLTDGIGAVEIAMTLFDATEQYDQRPMPAAAAPPAPGPLAGVRDAVAFEAGLAARAFDGLCEGGARAHRKQRSAPCQDRDSCVVGRGVDSPDRPTDPQARIANHAGPQPGSPPCGA